MRRVRPVILWMVLLAVVCREGSAWAQAPEMKPSLLSSSKASGRSLWQENWPEFSTTEAILTAAAAVGTGVIVLVGPARHPRWEGGILFDGAVRDELRGRNPETRGRFQTVGDYTYRLSPLIPLIDVLVVSAIGYGERKLTKNLGLITLEAYSYSGLASFVSTEISARARPDSQCQHGDCTGDTQSFFSGHSAIAATAAGLVCANHSRLALYGSAWADAAICGLSAANALATATTRVVADRHYASDVIAGAGVGFAIGYAVPVLLHYSRPGREIAILPDPTCGSTCIGVRATF